jgi:hypothetical protein
MQLTWEMVFAILGGMTSFLAFIYAMLKKDTKSDDNDDCDQHHDPLLDKVKFLSEQMAVLSKELDRVKGDNQKEIDRFKTEFYDYLGRIENRLEKMIDIVIKINTRDE